MSKSDLKDSIILENEWFELVSRYTDNQNIIYNMYSKIEKEFNSKNRFYRGLKHVKSILFKIKSFKEELEDYDSNLFAIWYQDLIYDPFAKITKKTAHNFL